jgi:hypothetical protein
MGNTNNASDYARPDLRVEITEVGAPPGGGPAETAGSPVTRRARIRPNPYFLAAWVLSVGTTAAGVALIVSIRSHFLNPPAFMNPANPYASEGIVMDPGTGAIQGVASAVLFPTPEVSALAPQLVVVGLLGVTLLLIVQGVMHRVPRSPAVPD